MEQNRVFDLKNRFKLWVGEAEKNVVKNHHMIYRINAWSSEDQNTETEGACSQPGFHHRNSLHRSLLMEETLAAISASITAVQHFYALEFSVAAVETVMRTYNCPV